MSIEEKKKKSKVPLYKRIMKNLYPIFLIFSALVLITSISAILISKTDTFKLWTAKLVSDIVNEQLQEGAKFEFEAVSISYLIGLELRNIRLTKDKDTILTCRALHAGVKLIPLLRNDIIVNELLIENPKVNLFRSNRDSLWNFEKVFVKSDDTTGSAEPELFVNLRRVRLVDADFRMYDSTKSVIKRKAFDENHFHLKDLNLHVAGKADLKEKDFELELKKLTFKDKYSGFYLKNLNLIAALNIHGIDLSRLNFTTNKTDISTNAKIMNVNIFSDKPDFENADIQLNCRSSNLNLNEIKKLVPVDIPLRNNINFEFSAAGKLNDFDVDFKSFKIRKTKISFRADLRNITNEKRVVSLSMNNSLIIEKEVKSILTIGDVIPVFENIQVNYLDAKYSASETSAAFDIVSPVFNCIADVNFNLDDYSYDGTVETQNVNLAKIFNNNNLQSNINTKVEFDGKGIDPEKIIANAKIELYNSKFQKYRLRQSNINLRVDEPGQLNIDTLKLQFLTKKDSLQNKEEIKGNKIFASGFLDYRNMKKPEYKLNFSINSFSASKILNIDALPSVVSSDISVSGQGIDLDEITANLNARFYKWKKEDRMLPNLNLVLNIDTTSDNKKSLKLQSDVLDIDFTGNYSYYDLIGELEQNAAVVSEQINQKLESFLESDSSSVEQSERINEFQSYNRFDFNLDLKFKDSELIRKYLNLKSFNTDLYVSLKSVSDSNSFFVNMDKISINRLIFDDSNLTVNLDNTDIQGKFIVTRDSIEIPKIHFDVTMHLPKGLKIDDLKINNFFTKLQYFNDNISFEAKGKALNQFDINTALNANIIDKQLDVSLNILEFDYIDKVKIWNDDRLSLRLTKDNVNIEKFRLKSDLLDYISLSGGIAPSGFENLNIKAAGFNFADIQKFVVELPEDISMFQGKLDSVDITLNGTMDNTYINLASSVSQLKVNGNNLGRIYTELQHKDSTLSGFLNAYYKNKDEYKNLLELKLAKVPVNLSVEGVGKRFDDEDDIELSLKTNKFPLELAAPFISAVKDLKGYSDIDVKLKGKSLKSVNYDGFIKYYKTGFLLDFNNMYYTSEGTINLKKDLIDIEAITLRNHYNDLKGGGVKLKGNVTLDELGLEEFDLKLYANKFKVLSQASMKSMPSLYGDFIISFGPNPLSLSGTLDKPNVRGDLNILRAALNMPTGSGGGAQKSKLIYEYKDKKTIDFAIVDDSSDVREMAEPEKKEETNEPGFADKLDIDVGIRFKGRFIMTLDLAGIGQLFAEIGTPTAENVLRFVDSRASDEPKIYGTEILVKEGSALKLIKMLETTGSISFPTGVLDNPALDLTASYTGQRFKADVNEQFTVHMYIKGTRVNPWISFGYEIDGREATGDSAKINEDALLLLTIGKTKEELMSGSSGNDDLMMSLSTSAASSLASSALTDFVQGSGFIQSADIDIGNSLTNFDQAKMRFSGEVSGIRWTLGGTMSDFASNNVISIDVPLPIELGNWMNHSIFQLTKTTSSTQATTTADPKEWEIKLKFGGSW